MHTVVVPEHCEADVLNVVEKTDRNLVKGKYSSK